MKLFKPCDFGITAHHKYFRIKKCEPLFFYNAYKFDNLVYIVTFTSHVFRTQEYFYLSFLAPQFDLQFERQTVLQFLTPHKNKLSIFKFNYPIFVDYSRALNCSIGLFCFVSRHWIKNINVRKKTDPFATLLLPKTSSYIFKLANRKKKKKTCYWS